MQSEVEKVFEGKPEWNCHMCEFKAHIKNEVKRHIAAEHGEKELKAYKLSFIKAWRERVGYVAPKPKPVESKVCPFCAGTFKYLEQHIKYKHESEKPWKCDKCDFAHATKMGLQVQNIINHKKNTQVLQGLPWQSMIKLNFFEVFFIFQFWSNNT